MKRKRNIIIVSLTSTTTIRQEKINEAKELKKNNNLKAIFWLFEYMQLWRKFEGLSKLTREHRKIPGLNNADLFYSLVYIYSKWLQIFIIWCQLHYKRNELKSNSKSIEQNGAVVEYTLQSITLLNAHKYLICFKKSLFMEFHYSYIQLSCKLFEQLFFSFTLYVAMYMLHTDFMIFFVKTWAYRWIFFQWNVYITKVAVFWQNTMTMAT